MNDFKKDLASLNQVLGYLEARATDDDGFALEADRARLIVAAIEARQGVEAMRLIELPLNSGYGGTGWQHIVSVGRALAQHLTKGNPDLQESKL